MLLVIIGYFEYFLCIWTITHIIILCVNSTVSNFQYYISTVQCIYCTVPSYNFITILFEFKFLCSIPPLFIYLYLFIYFGSKEGDTNVQLSTFKISKLNEDGHVVCVCLLSLSIISKGHCYHYHCGNASLLFV